MKEPVPEVFRKERQSWVKLAVTGRTAGRLTCRARDLSSHSFYFLGKSLYQRSFRYRQIMGDVVGKILITMKQLEILKGVEGSSIETLVKAEIDKVAI